MWHNYLNHIIFNPFKLIRGVFIWLPLLVILFSCKHSEKEHRIDESHAQENDKSIYALEGLEHGLIQSPVNILTSKTSEHIDHNIEIIINKADSSSKVSNTGHSVQLDFDSGSSIRFNGVEYEFLQAHFHTPSEHQIDGITYPMEIHFVCKEDTDEANYLVAGAFFKMGMENPFISSFIEKIPESPKHTANLRENPVYIDDLLLPEEPFNDYFHYRGSLTTTPYTESVEWFIMKKILEATPEQIQHINKLEGNNARHVQALFGRNIEK
ncbi:MAG: carbonic anhydrase family protein [Bacteroidales bacterium]|nr:carbonic anhydrase family protein [Bacteroidales bacterium]